MPVDENTRMDSTTVYNEFMITYYYTIHTVNSKDLDLAKFKTSMETAMNAKYKTDPQLAVYRDNNIAIAYDYKDKNGEFLSYFICGSK
jgi:accessory colonization factor AcfC